MTTIDVLVLDPVDDKGGSGVHLAQIDPEDYNEINRLVNGHIGTLPLPPSLRRQGFYAFCDDDGLVRRDTPPANPYGLHLGRARLVGPVVIVRTDEIGETLGLTRADVTTLLAYFMAAPTTEARALFEQDKAYWEDNPSGWKVVSVDSMDDFLKEVGQ